jgi:hypothetical protein
VEDGDDPLGAKRAKRILELARLVAGLVDERLDRVLAEGAELAAAEAADEALTPAKPTPRSPSPARRACDPGA